MSPSRRSTVTGAPQNCCLASRRTTAAVGPLLLRGLVSEQQRLARCCCRGSSVGTLVLFPARGDLDLGGWLGVLSWPEPCGSARRRRPLGRVATSSRRCCWRAVLTTTSSLRCCQGDSSGATLRLGSGV